MNKNAVKEFAIKARYKLISEISTKANMIGINESGISSPLPQSTSNIQYFDIGGNVPYSIEGEDIKKRISLINVINERIKSGISPKEAFQDTIEEIAYTWFNRIIAIRFMEVNDYLPSGIRVLSSIDKDKKEPDIVTNYYDADLNLSQNDISFINSLKDKNKPDELFKFLFIKQCNKLGEILPFLFEKTTDYCELMLSISYTDNEGIVNQLINSIDEEDFKEAVQIIGWMYQYYIAQKKEEVFSGLKNNTKISKSTLAAATQIFTPDWIVRYMTDNTLGKLWIESHNETNIKSSCEYYLEPAEQSEDVKVKLNKINEYYKNKKLEEITFIDPCCGSGHILVYAFDLFYKMYQEQGYLSSEIPTLILKNNLYGIDVDKRAMQLTCFALSMKARSYDKRFFKRPFLMPNVIDIHESNAFINDENKFYITQCLEKHLTSNDMNVLNDVLFKCENAELYGSLIKDFNYDTNTYNGLLIKLIEINKQIGNNINEIFTQQAINNYLIPLIQQSKILSKKYDIVVTNPPYAGNAKLPKEMQDFLKVTYPKTKSDLFSAFIERNMDYSEFNGHIGIMCPYNWMFIKSYQELREMIIKNKTITSLVQLSNSGFAEATVFICSFTFRNFKTNENGEYVRLASFKESDKQGSKTLEAIKNKKCGYRYCVSANEFLKIPGVPIAYWISDNLLNVFQKSTSFENLANLKQGIATANNAQFLRLWFEVNNNKIGYNLEDSVLAQKSMKKWFPYNKGGCFKRWYGNNDYIINYENDGKELKNYKGSVLRNPSFYFKECLTWSLISCSKISFRYKGPGFLFDVAGMSGFPCKKENIYYFLGLNNTSIIDDVMKIIAPTINYQIGDIAKIPIIVDDKNKNNIDEIVKNNIKISKNDWDQYETSWDFRKNSLLEHFISLHSGLSDGKNMKTSEIESFNNGNVLIEKDKPLNAYLKTSYENYKNEVNNRFNKLKHNEEELNHIFIDIYGLNDELSPEIEDKDITITKIFDNKEDVPENIKGNIYVRTKQDVIKDLISYIIGCIFGRYSLDDEGLAFAGGKFDLNNYKKFIPDKDNIIPITDDEYFDDDIVNRIVEFVETVYGKDSLEDNLQFIADALGNNGNTSREVIRNYLLKDFFNDHCKKYSNRPIYWLFDSGNNDGFKALVYLHRYTEDTIGKMRTDYLHKIQRIYENESLRMQDIIDNSLDNRDIAFARKQKEKLTKQLLETKEYDEILGHIALQRISLDLDDGVANNYSKFQNIEVVNNGRKIKKNLLVNIYKGKK